MIRACAAMLLLPTLALADEPPRVNVSKLIDRGAMPNRVHVAEDYETDIEKRWWMAGKLEESNVPPGSKRACRATLSKDFDDRMGDAKARYAAVIFNPVPGPPMGKSPRVSFRYWLKGTDTMRVQIFSLTNNYHRCLTLTGLPQGKWESGAVDMTQARRPDGSGGPLSENERIDDIQFYTDSKAELIIDEIVLYDTATKEEKRPFPSRVIFTGWFDTGKQGKEWPGDFTIAQKQGVFWHAARSIVDPKTQSPWLRVDLRGHRAVTRKSKLFFRYRLEGTSQFQIHLGSGVVELTNLKKGEWSEATVTFADVMRDEPRMNLDQLRFLLPAGSDLMIDDLLLYDP